MTYDLMLSIEQKLRKEFPYYDGVDFQENEDGTHTVLGVDVDVDIDPYTGRNRCHGVDMEPVWLVSESGEILQVLLEEEDEE